MDGGVLIGKGNNTCVYSPPIACVDGSEIPPGHVSRIVPSDSIEPAVQELIKETISKMAPKYKKHFNLGTKQCKAKFKESDIEKPCDVEDLQDHIKVGDTDLINILTPIQESDVNKPDGSFYKDEKTTKHAIKALLHAIVEMNRYRLRKMMVDYYGGVFHSDEHLGNFSWKGDNIVLHDWEKSTVGDDMLLGELTGYVNSWGCLLGCDPANDDRKRLKEYPHWIYPIRFIEALETRDNKSIKNMKINHARLELSHQFFFRFWDTISIIGPLQLSYQEAGLPPPKYLEDLFDGLLMYFIDLLIDAEERKAEERNFEKRKYEWGVSLPPLNIEERLGEVTDAIHDIINEAFTEAGNNKAGNNKAENNNAYMSRELLKLVAAHAYSSPDKKLLRNMVPPVVNTNSSGGSRKRNARSKRKITLKRNRKRKTTLKRKHK